MKTIYIAIDGGGTKTACLVSDKENIKEKFLAGPGNFSHRASFDKAIIDIFNQIYNFLANRNIKEIKLSITCGLAGIIGIKNSENDAQIFIESKIQEIFKNIKLMIAKIEIISDATMLLNAYFPNRMGIVAISGTGSICLAKDEAGKIYRTGGFGHLIDDIGSGFYFGKEALRIALYSKYHFKQKSILEKKLPKFYQLQLEEITREVYGRDKEFLARAAVLLFEAEKENCKYARKAILAGVEGLYDYIYNLTQALSTKPIEIVLHGSVFKKQAIITETLRKKLAAHTLIVRNEDLLERTIENETATQI